MNNLSKRVLAGLWGGVGLLMQASCGGGAEPAAQSLPQTIAFTSPGEQRFGTLSAPLVATASSGLPVSLVSSTPAVCAISGTRLALLSVGTCTMTAQQPGDAVFAPAATLSSSFGVAMGSQSITFVAPGNQALNTPPAALVATASSGLAVAFASSTPSVCSVTGSSLTLLGLGTCTLDASQAGTGSFQAAPAASQSFTVASGLLAQAINFAALGNQTLGSPAPALAASASSGLAVSFGVTTSDICSVSGNTLTLKAAGTCAVAASQAGSSRFAAAAAVINTFTVLPTAQSISFASPGQQTLGSPTAALAASASSGLPVGLASSTPDVCTNSGNTLVLVAVGSCTVLASQGGNANFAPAAPVSVSFAVLATPQTIRFSALGSQTLGSPPLALLASASSGLPVSLASTTATVCSVSGSSLTLLAVGTCSVSASQAGNAVYAAAAAVLRSFPVAAAPLIAQTISFAAPGNQTLAVSPVALVVSASSGLPVALSSSSPGVCAVSGSRLSLLAAGTCTVTANQAGNASFAAAPAVSQTLLVSTAVQSIAFNSPGNQTLGVAPAALSATASSGLPVAFASATAGVCSVSGNTLTLLALGSCSITASQAGNAVYGAAAPVQQTITISAAPLLAQFLSFSAPADQTLGTAPAALVASASSGLAVSLVSVTPAVCSVSGSTLTLVAAGSCSVMASQSGNATYAAAAAITRAFAVSKAAQTLTFTSPGTQTLGSTSALAASASSGLAVSFASSPPGVCSVSGNTLTPVSAGSCTVVASQAGNANFAAAAAVSQTVTVQAAAQIVTFALPGTQTVGSTATLSASASSGLAVSFASSTTGVCTVSGNTLTPVAAGTCSVTASQGGNGSFAAASPVTLSFTVLVAAQTVSFAAPSTQTVGTSISLAASASSGLLVAFGSATPAVCTVSGGTLSLVAAGTCTVTANQAGNGAYAAASPVNNSFTSAVEYFANGGFETTGAPDRPAFAWLAAAGGYTRSTDGHSGGFAAQLSSPAFNAAVMLQNSMEQGLRPALTVGDSPTLTFWAKGTAGGTGNVLFALRYLDGVGNIRANSGNRFFHTLINPNTWTKITYTMSAPVPAGAVAAFIEFSQAIGPIDAGNPAGRVLIDDLSLRLP